MRGVDIMPVHVEVRTTYTGMHGCWAERGRIGEVEEMSGLISGSVFNHLRDEVI